jgi:membrane protease YdiL (CAAX protease family)
MRLAAPPLKHVVAVLLALTLALFLRAGIQVRLQDAGWDRIVASDGAFLGVLPIMLLLLLPVLRRDRGFLLQQFHLRDLSMRIVISAIVIGLLIRTAWWAQLLASVSFGWRQTMSTTSPTSPTFSLNCPDPQLLVLGVAVTAVLIPLVEETVYRGYVQSSLYAHGPLCSIFGASLVFMVSHLYEGWLFALAGGLVLGWLYWVTGSLWASVTCHAVVNLIPQFTWRCLNPAWNPDPEILPLWIPGILGILVFLLSGLAIIKLVIVLRGRRGPRPRRPTRLQRVRHTFDDM